MTLRRCADESRYARGTRNANVIRDHMYVVRDLTLRISRVTVDIELLVSPLELCRTEVWKRALCPRLASFDRLPVLCRRNAKTGRLTAIR